MMGLRPSLRQEFERVALPHLRALHATGLRLTRDPRAAEDLVQDTILRAYRFFHRFEPGTNCKAWLFKILTNTFINSHRRAVRERRLWEEVEAEERAVEPAAAAAGDPEAALLHGVLGHEVQRALDSLPADFRLVVILADVEDFSYKEIAEIMDCPMGTVMSRLHRARRQLAASLREYAAERGIGRAAAAGGEPEPEPEPIRLDDFRRRRGP